MTDDAITDAAFERAWRAEAEVERLQTQLGVLADFIEANCEGVEVIGRDSGKWMVVS